MSKPNKNGEMARPTNWPRGRAKKRNFPGMVRDCPRCGEKITVTEKMCERSTYVCGPCSVAAAAAYVSRNREKKRAWNNKWQAKHSDQRAQKTKAYRARNPEKYAAHQAVQTAIRNSSLSKRPCEVCCESKAHAHHDDYSRQLDVIWLCHVHHMERHAMLAARKAQP